MIPDSAYAELAEVLLHEAERLDHEEPAAVVERAAERIDKAGP